MAENVPLIRLARVISINDPTDSGKIKVSLLPEDASKKSENELADVLPLLPKMIHIKPKLNEMVYIVTAVANNGNTQRYYIGPVISQEHHMNYEDYNIGAKSVLRGALTTQDQAPSTDMKTYGAFPDDEDISIEGRKNTGIQLKDNDLRLKAGVKVVDAINDRDIHFNDQNPSYIKLEYNDDKKVTKGGKSYQSTATVVADKINLIGNKTGFEVTDPEALITEDKMNEIIDKAHQLPYGDVLIEFLSLLKTAFITHTHAFSRKPPIVNNTPVEHVKNYDLNKILSNTVRIS